MFIMRFFFFFQAEDGIRDRTVTGVQTCALPILAPRHPGKDEAPAPEAEGGRGLFLVSALSLDPPADSGGPFPAPIPARGVFRGESGCGRPAARLACGLSGVPGSGAGFGGC